MTHISSFLRRTIKRRPACVSPAHRKLRFEPLENRTLLAGFSIAQTAINPSNGHTYHLLKAGDGVSGLKWTEAEAAAVSVGGHLVTINDAAENDWVVTTFNDFHLWIGLNDELNEGQFIWPSGQPVSFVNWASSEPNNLGGNEDYAQIFNWSQAGRKWNDVANLSSSGVHSYFGIAEIEPRLHPFAWHNATRNLDVNNDGLYLAGDALAVINYLNAFGPQGVLADAALGSPNGFIDTDGDNIVTASDALDVINTINARFTAPQATFELRQSTVREGDFFTVGATAPFIAKPVNVTLEHDGQPIYEYELLDVTGDSELRLVMPEVLLPGFAEDGYTLNIQQGTFTQRLALKVREGLRMTVDTDDVREGSQILFHVRNGIGNSEVIAELLKDGSVVQTQSFSTDGSGIIDDAHGHFQLDAHLLSYPEEVNGYKLRLSHAGKSVEKGVAIRNGLQVWTSSKNIREAHEFTIGGRQAVGKTCVEVTVIVDDERKPVTDCNKQTTSEGDFSTKYTMPSGIVKGSADRNGATIEVRTTNRVTGKLESFEFRVTVHKGHIEPDPQPSPPNNVAPPAQRPDHSFIGLATKAAQGASDSLLRNLVPSDVGNDAAFLPTVRGYGRPQGSGTTAISWLQNGLPSSIPELQKELTSSSWLKIKGLIAMLFPSPSGSSSLGHSMPVAQPMPTFSVELQSQLILEIAGLAHHASLLITPRQQHLYVDNNGDRVADNDSRFRLRDNGTFGLTIGAGPVNNRLVADLNRPGDQQIHTRRYFLATPSANK
jgi:hypothetical protein